MRALASTPFLGAVVALLTWPIASILPAIGPDPSWMAGLYMAAAGKLHFGTEVVFTYGPLGFLQAPVLYDETLWVVAFLYRGAIHATLAISLFWAARRAFPLPLAVAASYVLLVIGPLEGAVVLLALIWCVNALEREPPSWVAPVVVFGGGGLAAVELLGKANYGIAVFLLCLVTVLGMPDPRRNLGLFSATALFSISVLWALAGQGLGNVPEFASNAKELLSAYSRSMSGDVYPVTWERWGAVATVALLMAGAVYGGGRDPWPRRLATLVLVALFSFLTFKQGFVRQGLGGTPEFFTLMFGAGIAVAARFRTRMEGPARYAAATALVAPLTLAALAALPGSSIWRSLQPEHHVSHFRGALDALLEPAHRQRLVAEARRSMRSAYRIDAAALRALGHRPVHVEPWEIGAAWAYGLNWHPLPVFQGYAAYTPRLDGLNADALAGRGGPAAILRHSPRALAGRTVAAIDGRYPAWDPPAASRAMLCNFRAVNATGRWQLLERVRNRCTPPRPVVSVRTESGREIRVPPLPAGEDIVFARIRGLEVGGVEALRAALYRAHGRKVRFPDGRAWTLVPETASDGLIMRASARADFTPPFQLAPNTRAFVVEDVGGRPRRIEVSFFAQRVRPHRLPAANDPRHSIQRRSRPIAGI